MEPQSDGRISKKYIRWEDSPSNTPPLKEQEEPSVRHRWIKLPGIQQWTEIIESGRAGPRSESSQINLDKELTGTIHPNWKTLGKKLGIFPPKFMRYFIWKVLFEPEEIQLTIPLLNSLYALLPEKVRVQGGPSYHSVVRKKINKKTKKVEKYSLWELKPDHEELLYSRLLFFIFPKLQENVEKENPFILTKTERRIILGFLRQYGEDHFAIKRGYKSQKKTSGFERVIEIISIPMKPSRKRARPPRRRRSSEDRSGKPGLSRLGNLPTERSPRNLPKVEEAKDGLPLLRYRGRPEDELLSKDFFEVDPSELRPIEDYIQSLCSQGLIRRRNLLQSPLVVGRISLVERNQREWGLRSKDNNSQINQEILMKRLKTIRTLWVPPWERED